MPVSLPPHQWDLLLRCPLFQACPEALVRDVLARSGCSVEDFSSGAEIYRPDRFRRCLGLLLSGRVLVTKGSLTVSTLEPGDLFGAAALAAGVELVVIRRPRDRGEGLEDILAWFQADKEEAEWK